MHHRANNRKGSQSSTSKRAPVDLTELYRWTEISRHLLEIGLRLGVFGLACMFVGAGLAQLVWLRM